MAGKNSKEESDISVLDETINKIMDNNQQITMEEFMLAYTVIFNISKPYQWSAGEKRLYEKYKKIWEDYVTSKMLPHLIEKNGQDLLKEIVEQWDKYTTLQRRLSGLFHYLERYFIESHSLPSLLKVSHSIVYNLVITKIEDEARSALVIPENNREVDEAVRKKVAEIYEEISRVMKERP